MSKAPAFVRRLRDRVIPAIPPLLKKRVKKYGITAACFDQLALFDRALLWQIPLLDDTKDKAMAGGRIIAPEAYKAREATAAPRGVVVTAGLGALDYLWAHGAEIGSIVKFVRLSPWHMPVAFTPEGKSVYLQVVRVGDAVACEDLVQMRREGRAELVRRADGTHQWRIDGHFRPRIVDPSDGLTDNDPDTRDAD